MAFLKPINTSVAETVVFQINGNGSAITTGSKGYVDVPFNGIIRSWTVLADQSGSIVVDVKKGTYFAFPTTASICGGSQPVLTSQQKNTNSTLTGWTTTVLANDILEFVVNSASTVTRVTILLHIERL